MKLLICVVLYDFKSSPLKLVVPEGGASERPGDCSSLSSTQVGASPVLREVFSLVGGLWFLILELMTVLCAKSFLFPPAPSFDYVTWLELADLPASPSQAMGFKARTTMP